MNSPLPGSVVIVDPIWRGGRLHYAALLSAALHGSASRVTLVCRKAFDTEHFRELFAGDDSEIVPVLSLSPDAWFRPLNRQEAMASLQALHDVCSHCLPDAVVFCGINEWLPQMIFHAGQVHRMLNGAPLHAIDHVSAIWYRGSDVPVKKRLSYAIKRLAMRYLLKRIPTLVFWTLDERIQEPDLSWLPHNLKHRFYHIPDPCPDVSPPDTAEHAEPDRPLVILAVGLQSRRKGIADIVELLHSGRIAEGRMIHLVGRLDSDTEVYRRFLESRRGIDFKWTEGFLSDQELAAQYRSADYILLPYTRDFDGSSGVLAHAAGFGKPVIATGHGLIGYRVARYGLGVTYVAGKASELRQAIEALPSRDSADYQQLRHALHAFAETCATASFKAQVRSHVRAAAANTVPAPGGNVPV